MLLCLGICREEAGAGMKLLGVVTRAMSCQGVADSNTALGPVFSNA